MRDTNFKVECGACNGTGKADALRRCATCSGSGWKTYVDIFRTSTGGIAFIYNNGVVYAETFGL